MKLSTFKQHIDNAEEMLNVDGNLFGICDVLYYEFRQKYLTTGLFFDIFKEREDQEVNVYWWGGKEGRKKKLKMKDLEIRKDYLRAFEQYMIINQHYLALKEN